MKTQAFVNRATLFAAIAACAASSSACSSYNKDAVTVMTECLNGPGNPAGCNTPAFNSFMPPGDDNNKIVGVGDFMIQRCGSLDCHGQVGRPLRLYGYGALKLPLDGGQTNPNLSTTPDEYQASFDTVVALQPEDMVRVMTGSQNPNTLLLLLKPTNSLVHKGGAVISDSPPDPGFQCLAGWLTYNSYANTAVVCPQAVITNFH